jgi:hypothetical protein
MSTTRRKLACGTGTLTFEFDIVRTLSAVKELQRQLSCCLVFTGKAHNCKHAFKDLTANNSSFRESRTQQENIAPQSSVLEGILDVGDEVSNACKRRRHTEYGLPTYQDHPTL